MGLKAGVGSAVITPPIGYRMRAWGMRTGGSTGVHDDLYAKALVLSDGKASLALISLDVTGISSEKVVDDIRNRVQQSTGIEKSNVMISSSHSHTGPDFSANGFEEYKNYVPVFSDYVSGAVIEAYSNLKNASIGTDTSELYGISVNRNFPEEPVDTQLGVFKIEDSGGKLIAALYNFADHGVDVGGQYLLWTAGFPGFAAKLIEESYSGSKCMFLQGAEGDVHPWDWWFGNDKSKYSATYEDSEKLGRIIGSEVLKKIQTMHCEKDVELKSSLEKITLPKREKLYDWPLDKVERVYNEARAKYKPWAGLTAPADVSTAMLGQKYPENYALGMISRIRDELTGAVKLTDLETELQVFKIGDIKLVAVPGELFNQLGVEIKKSASSTFCLGCANAYTAGYIPTKRIMDMVKEIASTWSLEDYIDQSKIRKYYGATAARVSGEAGEEIVQQSKKIIEKLT
ncbi:neutral/alkaline non-lysosomal ceramidase N-terminal domain-containing protein [Candidatus Bathyarchaeota archaeon]|nr:neutral/alkaline non-lysosomal ceramidase N-terminal domain-containing protein [Candidatus Bathyarchaeota archaeon]